MRVLHVLPTLDPAAGGPVEAARLYSSQTGPGCEIEILSLDEDDAPWRSQWSVPVHSGGTLYTKYRYSPAATRWLSREVSRFDAVVVHGIWHYHLPAVWRACRRSHVPYFVILHGMLNPWFKRAYPLKHLKKWLFWRAAVGRAIEDAAAVLFLCEEERRLANQTFQLKPRGEAVAPLGIRPVEGTSELFLHRHPELRSKRLLLFLGRICFMKGCDLLIDAFASVANDDPRAHLVIAGPDHEGWQTELTRRADRHGLGSRVTWTGPLYANLKWSALAAADLFLLPSRCETFPVAVLEALACGCPVLITEEVNTWPTVRAAGAGLVCRSTTESVSIALAEWLALHEFRAGDYRRRALQCFRDHYQLDFAFEEHLNAIRTYTGREPLLSKASAAVSSPCA